MGLGVVSAACTNHESYGDPDNPLYIGTWRYPVLHIKCTQIRRKQAIELPSQVSSSAILMSSTFLHPCLGKIPGLTRVISPTSRHKKHRAHK